MVDQTFPYFPSTIVYLKTNVVIHYNILPESVVVKVESLPEAIRHEFAA